MARVGFIGLGRMGSRMAARLIDAGHELTVYNRTAEKAAPLVAKGAKLASTPAQAADGAAIVFTNLADGAALQAACMGPNGVFSASTKPALLADMATISPSESATIAKEIGPLGISYLRAPVIGSTGVAEAGKLTIIVSGEKAVYDQAEPYLAVLGETRFYVGDGEKARYLKLLIQMHIATQVQILAESLVLGEKAGIDWATTLEVISNSVVASGVIKVKSAILKDRNFSPAFTTNMMMKDLNLVLDAAQDADSPIPVTKLAREFYQQAVNAGLGDLDFAAVSLELEKQAGITWPK